MRYQLATNGEGEIPIALPNVKDWLRVTNDLEDHLLTDLMMTAVEHCESYTGREVRANTWELLLTNFDDPICLIKSPVASITSIEYTVSGSLVTIASSVWTLVKKQIYSEIHLKDEQEWPTDLDDNLENGIKVTFVTEAVRHMPRIKTALYQHISAMYSSRGDGATNKIIAIDDLAKACGAENAYNKIRIARV